MRISLVLLTVLLIFTPTYAQVSGSKAEIAAPTEAQPKLPVINENACPFEGCTFGQWKVTKDSPLFSTWQPKRAVIGTLHTGEDVTAVTGVHITIKPDVIRVIKPIPALSLSPGDTILRYMYRGEGFADIWAKGKWIKEADCSFITEKNGDGCARNCSAVVEQDGMKEWWVKLQTSSGLTGWTKVEHNFDGMDALASLLPR